MQCNGFPKFSMILAGWGGWAGLVGLAGEGIAAQEVVPMCGWGLDL